MELRYFDGLSIEETAEALEWVHSSVDGLREGRTATDRITDSALGDSAILSPVRSTTLLLAAARGDVAFRTDELRREFTLLVRTVHGERSDHVLRESHQTLKLLV